MKVRVDSSDGLGVIRAKIWQRNETEPATWTIEARDLIPHRQGSPGLYGYSSADILYDNISVKPIGKEQ